MLSYSKQSWSRGQKARDGNPSIVSRRLLWSQPGRGPGVRAFFTQWLIIASLEGQWPKLNWKYFLSTLNCLTVSNDMDRAFPVDNCTMYILYNNECKFLLSQTRLAVDRVKPWLTKMINSSSSNTMIRIRNLDLGHLIDTLNYLATPTPKSSRFLITFSWIM